MSSQAFIFNPQADRLSVAGVGFQTPRMTSSQRNSLSVSVGDAGLMLFDVTLGAPFIWTGTAWLQLGSGSIPYLEGSFTATFLADSGTITLDPAARTGRWSRIGNQVTITGSFTVQSVSNPSGLLVIDNLPFPVEPGFDGAATVTVTGLSNGARTAISAQITGNGIRVWHYDSGDLLDLADKVDPASEWHISATYFTS